MGGLKVWLGVGVAGVVLVGLLVIQSLRLEAAGLRETAERDRADANAAVVAQQRKDAELYARVMSDFAGIVGQLQEDSRARQDAIWRAPTTNLCADSPAARAYIDGVRARTRPPADGRPAAAGRPAGAMP
jgi:hypothetical protein